AVLDGENLDVLSFRADPLVELLRLGLRLVNQIKGLSDKFPFRAHIETIDEFQFVGMPKSLPSHPLSPYLPEWRRPAGPPLLFRPADLLLGALDVARQPLGRLVARHRANLRIGQIGIAELG